MGQSKFFNIPWLILSVLQIFLYKFPEDKRVTERMMCICVCVRDRDTERDRDRKDRQTENMLAQNQMLEMNASKK